MRTGDTTRTEQQAHCRYQRKSAEKRELHQFLPIWASEPCETTESARLNEQWERLSHECIWVASRERYAGVTEMGWLDHSLSVKRLAAEMSVCYEAEALFFIGARA
jgi:hypothetical protein